MDSTRPSQVPLSGQVVILDGHSHQRLGKSILKVLRADSGYSLSLLLNQSACDFHSGCATRNAFPGADLTSLIIIVVDTKHDPPAPETMRWADKYYPGCLSLVLLDDAALPSEIISYLVEGASDVVICPVKPNELLGRVGNLLRLNASESNARAIESPGHHSLRTNEIIGNSSALKTALKELPMIAPTLATVLITGETGTGKEVCARAIHYASPRGMRPFVPINCGAIPGDLIENDLFGHEPGAYTSAQNVSKGLIASARGGTLFLDEIDALSLSAQVKFLRFLHDGEIRRLGGNAIQHSDVRVLAATNADLPQLIQEKRFRSDLWYRLSVIVLEMPPLRDRGEDILLLAKHFLRRHATAYGRDVPSLNPVVIRMLMDYQWPGNIRELSHVLEHAVIVAKSDILEAKHFPLPIPMANPISGSFASMKSKVVANFEKDYLRHCLAKFQGNISKAAQASGKNRRAFWELLRKHHLLNVAKDPDLPKV